MTERARRSSFSPIFSVAELGRALAHYQSLGFTIRPYEPADLYGFADRDGVGLQFSVRLDRADDGHGGQEAYLYVDDADALFAEWSAPGIGGTTRVAQDTPYMLREGTHRDPDGNLIRFGSPMETVPERLRAHLEAQYGIQTTAAERLDHGVYRVNLSDGTSWVARVFAASRPIGAALGDAEILRFLEAHDFPAERCAATEPVSVLAGRPVLVTGYVDGVVRAERRQAVKAMGGIRRLGDLLGHLHTLPVSAGVVARSGGAWHHLAEGEPRDELSAAKAMLMGAQREADPSDRRHFETLWSALDSLDDCAGLPEALVHPDFVLMNVVAAPARGLVLVDWTGAGRGPRLWSLAFVLFAEGAKSLKRIDLVAAGYRQHVTLEPEELERMAGVVRARPLVFAVWALGAGRRTVAQVAADAAKSFEIADRVVERARAVFGKS